MFNLIQNYIYLYHIDKFIILPTFPESIQDSLAANFSSVTPLSRSAPIFAYSNSGPRTIQVSLSLHRDMMTELNWGVSNINPDEVQLGYDYVDVLIRQLQAIALPQYETASKMVNPPMVALRFGNEIYIKGIVQGGITVTYSGPILEKYNNKNIKLEGEKYAKVDIAFTVYEVDPYDAQLVAKNGSFRGLNTTLERNLYNK